MSAIQPDVLDLVEEWQRRRSEGIPVDLQELAGHDEEVEAELRAALRLLEACAWLDRPQQDDEQRDTTGAASAVTQKPETTEVTAEKAGESIAGPPVDQYLIVDEHRQGGLGIVYLAEDRAIGRKVALKQVRPDRRSDPALTAKFRREARIAGQLEHPGIVPVYSVGDDDRGEPYYAMRFVGGEDLQTAIRNFHEARRKAGAPLDGPELRRLLRRYLDACNAVGYAHEQGVVHRDLKPANVMLGEHGETLVVDWGLARDYSQETVVDGTQDSSALSRDDASKHDEHATVDGSVVGTPAYAAPEQLLGRIDRIGPASDIFGLGAILFELLVGQSPVDGATQKELIDGAERGRDYSPRRLLAEVPRPLDAICRKAMAANPELRYAGAAELRSDVEAWLDDRPISARKESILEQGARMVRRRRQLAVGLIAALLVTLVGGVVAFWLDQARRTSEREAEVERYFAATSDLQSTLLEKPRGWIRKTGELLREARSLSPSAKDDERLKLDSAAALIHIGRELVEDQTPDLKLTSPPFAVIPSPDGRRYALPQGVSWTSLACSICDAESGAVERTLVFEKDLAGFVEGLLRGRPDGLRAVAFNDDATRIAIAARAGELLVWQIGVTLDDKPVELETDNASSGSGVVWLRDGRSFVVAFEDGELQLWREQEETYRLEAKATFGDKSHRLFRSPDDDTLYLRSRSEVRAIDGSTLKEVKRIASDWDDFAVAGDAVAVMRDESLHVADRSNFEIGAPLLAGDAIPEGYSVAGLAIDASASYVLLGLEGDQGKRVLLIDAASGEVLSDEAISPTFDARPVFVAEDAVAAVSDRGVRRWKIEGYDAHRVIGAGRRAPVSISWSASAGIGSISRQDRLLVYRVDDDGAIVGSDRRRVPGNRSVSLSERGDRFVAYSAPRNDRSSMIAGEIDPASGVIRSLSKPSTVPGVELVAWEPAGENLWIAADAVERLTWPSLEGGRAWVAPGVETFASGLGTVTALDATRGQIVGGFRGGRAFQFPSDDERPIGNSSKIAACRILDVSCVPTADEAYFALEDGRLFAAALPSMNAREVSNFDDAVVAVDVSPQGDRLLAAGGDVVRIWSRQGVDLKETLSLKLGRRVVVAGWADPSAQRLFVRLDGDRGVRILHLPHSE